MDKMTKNQFIVSVLVVVLGAMIAFPSAMAKGKPACNDRVDNDGDGYVDMNDPGCSGGRDKSELNPYVECDDGFDNDRDGMTDYLDAGCSGPADGDESNCGDSICEGAETSSSCPVDCGYADSCADIDGGNNINVAGVISGYYGNNFYSNADTCLNDSVINEYYCDGDYAANQVQSCGAVGYGPYYCVNNSVYRNYNNAACSGGACATSIIPQFVQTCQYGCTNGECNQEVPPPPEIASCTDTDNGLNIYVQGTTYGYSNEGTPYSYTDTCLGNTMLLEYACSNTQEWTSYNYTCPRTNTTGICVSGSCR